MPGCRRSIEEQSILATRFRVDVMDQADVTDVSRIERRCFDNPWPSAAYRRELRNPRQNYYVVLRANADDFLDEFESPRSGIQSNRLAESIRAKLPILHLSRRSGFAHSGAHIAGFAGMWCVYDEAHVTTIGVDPHYRGRGFGEVLLLALFDEAVRRGANWLTLEVRVSNEVAKRLYAKYGMSVQTTRKHYYSDNGEDAYLMWSRSLRDTSYLEEIDELRLDLRRRLAPEIEVPSRSDILWRRSETP